MNPRQTVFIVDDEAPVRKALRLMLQTAGYQVEAYGSAEEFLGAYDPSRPGCLILDVRMPGMDGMELLRHLIEHRHRIPVIMLTAHGDIPMTVDAIHTGALDFLEKPVDPEVLRQKLAAALVKNTEQRLEQEELDEILQRLGELTRREREVLDLLVDGKPVRTVARALGTAQSTVRNQRASILKKMRADTVADLMKMMAVVHRNNGSSTGS